MKARTHAPYVLSLLAIAVFVIATLGSAGGQTQRWIDGTVASIATAEEKRDFDRLSTDADRERFEEIFWLRRDPDLSTSENEYHETYEQRIEIADEQLGGPTGSGSSTDMGQVFLLFGTPSAVTYSREALGDDPHTGRRVEASEMLEASTTQNGVPDGSESMPRTQTWEYAPDPSIGLRSGLVVSFRAQPGFGYRLSSDDVFEEAAEGRRKLIVKNPDIGYELDPEGRLLPPIVPQGPRVAGEILTTLVDTKSPSGAIGVAARPAYFRSQENSTYVAMLIQLEEGSVSFDAGRADLTFFGAIEDADGELVERFVERVSFLPGTKPQFEMPLQLTPGNYLALVGVVDGAGTVHGSGIASVRAPGFDSDGLQLSSVVAYRTAEQTEDPAGIPGRAFQFGSTKLEPLGSQPLGPEDSLGVYYHVYGVAGADVTARYFFFRDGVQLGQTQPQTLAASGGIALGSSEIPLASFEAGDYQVIVQVEDATASETVQSRARFTLER